ncbi:zinc finger MYM-type protein 5-like [Hydra vulgaris]|uniref:zinc finger MYM-type protein 5-like n=1 Tax=Hydra vulgaris TaxID=6087 RepID=UPI0032EA676C
MFSFKEKDSGCQNRKNEAYRPTVSRLISINSSQSRQAFGINSFENESYKILLNSGEPLPLSSGTLAISATRVENENNILHKDKLGEAITTNDPALWAENMSIVERDAVVLQGPPKNLLSFPRDSNKVKVPESVFHEISRNGEKINRDWLVWSATSKSFLCFPCSLFGSKQACGAGNNSHLLRWNGGINGSWRKLAEKEKGHQNNPHHLDNYIKWKTALESLGNQCGIDSSLKKLIRNEYSTIQH